MRKGFKRLLVTTLICSLGIPNLSLPIHAAEEEENPDVVLAYKTHFDIGFTDYAENVIHKYRTTFIDGALDSIEKSNSLPKEEQFKWIVPGWPLTKMMEDWSGQTKERQDKIGEAIENDRILVHALPFSLESESLDLEDMVRSMSYSSNIARKYGKELPKSGKMTDVPEQSWILPTVLNNAGINFLHIGINPASMPADVPPLFWWEGPDGSRVLTMYSADYGVGALPPEDWPYDVWLGLKMTGDNAGPPSIQDVENDINQVKNAGKTYTIGSMDDFAEAILKTDTSKIPVVRGDMPDTWIHGIMAAPNETKISRNTRPKVLQLDSLNTMLNYLDIADSNVENTVNQAYDDALRFGEHTWGFNEHIEDYGDKFKQNKENGNYKDIEASWDEKGSLTQNMQDSVVPVLKKKLKTLADSVNTNKDRIVVYNSLPWERDGVVEVEFEGKAPKSLVNVETNEKVAVDSVKDGVLKFTAKDIPSMGYATYTFSNEAVEANNISLNKAENVMENDFFKITLDPVNGSISSIYDKKLNREMIDTKNNKYGFSQYLNERFSNDEVLAYNKAYNTQQVDWAYDDMSKTGLNTDEYKNVKHEDSVAKNLAVTYEQNGNSVTATMKGAAVADRYAGMSLKITLYSDQDYIDIDWAIDGKVEDPWPMADWLTFPFAIENPQYRLYRLGGVMNPETDIVTDTQVNNLALDGGLMIVDDEGKGIGMCSKDAPLVSIGKPGIWKFDKGENAFDPEEPTVFLNLFNNQWDTNYPTWNGGNWSTNVRLWSVDSMDYEKSLVTPSKETRSDLIGAYSNAKGGKEAINKEGVKLSKKGIEVTAFGPNIDGDGTILRLWEQSGKDQEVTVTLPKEMKVTSVIPVDLRGQQTGKAIRVKNNQFTIKIGKNAPYSILLDYDVADTKVDEVKNVKAECLDDLGNVQVTWENPEKYNYEKVEISYKNAKGNGDTVTVDALDKKVKLEGLDTASNYTITLKGKDIEGNTSKGVSVKVHTTGKVVLSVADANSPFGFNSSYDPINLVNGNGLTGMNPDTAKHNNDRTAYSMWHSYSNGNNEPIWIDFDFGEPKAIDQMYVWNMNQVAGEEDDTTRGFKNVKIEYRNSEDEDWKALDAPEGIEYKDPESVDAEYPFQLAKASGEDGILATNLNTDKNEPISFDGITARYVRITAKDSWGQSYWGLSEVMFTEKQGVEISSFEKSSVTTIVGQMPKLPSTVKANLKDSEAKQTLEVEWDAIPEDKLNEAGEFTVKGHVYGTDLQPECVVTVNKPLQPEQVPTDVKVADNDGKLNVSWKEPAADYEKAVIKVTGSSSEQTKEIKKGTTEANFSIPAGSDYKVEIWLEDEFGYVSDSVVKYIHIDGSSEVVVKSAESNSSWGGGVDPSNVINKSGLSGTDVTNYVHDNDGDAKTMWHTTANPKDLYISFDFGDVKALDKMYIWNMNQKNETDNTTRGLKNVKIEYSVDGTEWNTLKAPEGITYNDPNSVDPAYPFQLAKASGENGIPATNLNTKEHEPISFNGVSARYVKITPKDNYGQPYYGLSEVVFTQINNGKAVSAEDVNVETTVGKAVELPAFTTVNYDNNTTETKAVVWDTFDKDVFNKVGEFTVNGKVFGTDLTVKCTIKVLDKNTEVNKNGLLQLMNKATAKVEEAYSSDSWKVLSDAMIKADTVYMDVKADQKTVDAMCDELQAAIDQLVLVVSPEKAEMMMDELEARLEKADVFYGEEGYEGQIPVAVYEEVQTILAKARADYADLMNNVTEDGLAEYDKSVLANIQSNVEKALDELNAAVVHINFDELQKELESSSKLEKDEYTIDSWNVFEAAKTKAEYVLEHSNVVKQSDVDKATKELSSAINGLVLRDKTDWTPIEPSNPVDPEEPTTPENPIKPIEPSKPVTPGKPNKPEKPSTPETPNKGDKESDKENVKTGVESSIGLMMGLLMLSGAGIAFMFSRKKEEK